MRKSPYHLFKRPEHCRQLFYSLGFGHKTNSELLKEYLSRSLEDYGGQYMGFPIYNEADSFGDLEMEPHHKTFSYAADPLGEHYVDGYDIHTSIALTGVSNFQDEAIIISSTADEPSFAFTEVYCEAQSATEILVLFDIRVNHQLCQYLDQSVINPNIYYWERTQTLGYEFLGCCRALMSIMALVVIYVKRNAAGGKAYDLADFINKVLNNVYKSSPRNDDIFLLRSHPTHTHVYDMLLSQQFIGSQLSEIEKEHSLSIKNMEDYAENIPLLEETYYKELCEEYRINRRLVIDRTVCFLGGD